MKKCNFIVQNVFYLFYCGDSKWLHLNFKSMLFGVGRGCTFVNTLIYYYSEVKTFLVLILKNRHYI